MSEFELIDLEEKAEVLNRVKRLETELSQELERPVALIVYTKSEAAEGNETVKG